MDIVKISYDFNVFLKYGYDNPVPLSRTDYIDDFEDNTVVLSEGMDIRIIEIDYDIFDREDNLYADGVAVYISDDGDFKWWFQMNNFGVKHESDNPDFHLPGLSANEKRNIIYTKIEDQILRIDNDPYNLVSGQLEYYIRMLREIDNGEL